MIFFLIKIIGIIIRIFAWLKLRRRLGSLLRRLTMSNFRSFVKFVSSGKEVHVRELTVDRSGLTVRREGTRTHLPWRDIAQIGVLQPEHGALNRRLLATQYKRKHVLAVRLRPEIPAPSVVSMLSDKHRQLGYIGLCTLEGLRSSRQEMISALERFAGGKLVHSSRQFLDRDPRLRPEMV